MAQGTTANVEAFLDEDTETWSYVVYDHSGGRAAVIDPVLDFDPKSGSTDTKGAERLVHFVRDNDLTLDWILETHAHADHLSAAPFIRNTLRGKLAIGEHITEVQSIFKRLFNLGAEFVADGRQFDRLIGDGDSIRIGELTATAIFTPGHTPADLSWLIGGALFVGDTLFMPDAGTARCDFPGGDAATLYRSIQRLYSYDDNTPIYVCHDYPPDGRPHQCRTSVGAQKNDNIHIRADVTEADFVALREKRDAGLDMPRLILPSVQVNIRAGDLPPAEDNGVSYLKIPLNQLA